ncbi:MAG: MCE family protein [Alphaproteobacteria bacterium]|nr:MCE family protein [Alphaproteobacteria bacterium]
MERTRIERLVGGGVIVAGLVFLLQAYASTAPRVGYALSASFDRVEGIGVGSEVRLGGVEIGRVTGVGIDPKTFRPRLTLSIADAYRLPRDSVAAVRGDGLIGSKYVKVVPGNAQEKLAPGAAFAATENVIDVEAMIRRIVELAVE